MKKQTATYKSRKSILIERMKTYYALIPDYFKNKKRYFAGILFCTCFLYLLFVITQSSLERKNTEAAFYYTHAPSKASLNEDESDELPQWKNTSGAFSNDSDAAWISFDKKRHGRSRTLYLSNFEFESVDDRRISGIEIVIQRHSEHGTLRDAKVHLLKNGILLENKAKEQIWNKEEEIVTYGGKNDLWGTTWDIDDIIDDSFSVALAAECGNSCIDDTGYIHQVGIIVYYEDTKGKNIKPLLPILSSVTKRNSLDDSSTVTESNGATSDDIQGLNIGTCTSRDDFSGSLDKDWLWLRERNENWRNDSSGNLVINAERGSLWGRDTNNMKNILLRHVTDQDFTIQTSFHFSPTGSETLKAGLIVYGDDDNFIESLALSYPGKQSFVHVTEIEGTGDSVEIPFHNFFPTTVYLKIEKQGDFYQSYSSLDGITWTKIHGSTFSKSNLKVGLFASNGTSTSSFTEVAFDYFCLYEKSKNTATPTKIPLQQSSIRSSLGNNECKFGEDFSLTKLNDRFFFIRERSETWNLTERPGFLRLKTEQGNLWGTTGNDAKNILLFSVPDENFSFKTKISLSALQGSQLNTGIIVYQDDDNYLQLVRTRYENTQSFVHVAEIQGQGNTVELPASGTEVYLRIDKEGSLFATYFSLDGIGWTAIHREFLPFTNIRLGVFAHNGTSETTLEPVDVDYLCLSDFRSNTAPLTTDSGCSYFDDFASEYLDAGWRFLRESTSRWSLTNRPNFLRIFTETGTLWGRNNNSFTKNILLRNSPKENFEIRTRLSIEPSTLMQQAGIMMYRDDDTYVQALRLSYGGINSVVHVSEIDGTGNTVELPNSASTIFLKLRKIGSRIGSEYSIDGRAWFEISGVEFPYDEIKIGLSASNETSKSALLPVDFDFFCVEDYTVTKKTPSPVIVQTNTPTSTLTPTHTPTSIQTVITETPTSLTIESETATSTTVASDKSMDSSSHTSTPVPDEEKVPSSLYTTTGTPKNTVTTTVEKFTPFVPRDVIACPKVSHGFCDDYLDESSLDRERSTGYQLVTSGVTVKEGEMEATLISLNLLYGFSSVGRIHTVMYSLHLPSGADAFLQISEDGEAWFNAEGIQNGITRLNNGIHKRISIRYLGFSKAKVYYRIILERAYLTQQAPLLEHIAVLFDPADMDENTSRSIQTPVYERTMSSTVAPTIISERIVSPSLEPTVFIERSMKVPFISKETSFFIPGEKVSIPSFIQTKKERQASLNEQQYIRSSEVLWKMVSPVLLFENPFENKEKQKITIVDEYSMFLKEQALRSNNLFFPSLPLGTEGFDREFNITSVNYPLLLFPYITSGDDENEKEVDFSLNENRVFFP